MKKFSLCILAGLLALVLFLNPISVKAENPAEENAPAVSLTYTSLEESKNGFSMRFFQIMYLSMW